MYSDNNLTLKKRFVNRYTRREKNRDAKYEKSFTFYLTRAKNSDKISIDRNDVRGYTDLRENGGTRER